MLGAWRDMEQEGFKRGLACRRGKDARLVAGLALPDAVNVQNAVFFLRLTGL